LRSDACLPKAWATVADGENYEKVGMLMGKQLTFPFAPFKQSQRAKHFQRRKKVFGQFFTPANFGALPTFTSPQQRFQRRRRFWGGKGLFCGN
jgi:hypothetical protein